jgi:hypothetical protein
MTRCVNTLLSLQVQLLAEQQNTLRNVISNATVDYMREVWDRQQNTQGRTKPILYNNCTSLVKPLVSLINNKLRDMTLPFKVTTFIGLKAAFTINWLFGSGLWVVKMVWRVRLPSEENFAIVTPPIFPNSFLQSTCLTNSHDSVVGLHITGPTTSAMCLTLHAGHSGFGRLDW